MELGFNKEQSTCLKHQQQYPSYIGCFYCNKNPYKCAKCYRPSKISEWCPTCQFFTEKVPAQ